MHHANIVHGIVPSQGRLVLGDSEGIGHLQTAHAKSSYVGLGHVLGIAHVVVMATERVQVAESHVSCPSGLSHLVSVLSKLLISRRIWRHIVYRVGVVPIMFWVLLLSLLALMVNLPHDALLVNPLMLHVTHFLADC